jgi:hypothetical protein
MSLKKEYHMFFGKTRGINFGFKNVIKKVALYLTAKAVGTANAVFKFYGSSRQKSSSRKH